MPQHWRILVSGVGSVGERHIRNLLALGLDDIAVHRTRALPLRTLERELPAYADLAQALRDWRPHVVFATGPTALHVPVARAAAEAGCHVFVEKPLSQDPNGIEGLARSLARNERFLMVGYMLRFHPLLARLRDWVASGSLGRPLHWRSEWGEYLPDWHPWEDYRSSYAARRELGGGPALTLSHDLDLACWLFGEVREAQALPMPDAPLALDFPPGVDLLLRHDTGVASNLHLDLYQRPTQRSYALVATRGRVAVDYAAGRMTLHRYPDDDAVSRAPVVADTPTETLTVPAGWERNDMFKDELEYFFRCLEQGRPPEPGLAAGAAVTALAAALGDGGSWRAQARGPA
jgi:predicted dehydrogenase